MDRLCVVEGGEGGVVEAAAGEPLPWRWRAGGRNLRQLPRVLAWGGEAVSLASSVVLESWVKGLQD